MTEEARPAQVLLDLNLPLMDGREVLREIRNDPDLTVVVLTTSQSEEDNCKAYKLHANCYIPKPFSKKDLALKLREALDASTGYPDLI